MSKLHMVLALQTALLLFLGYRVMTLEGRTGALAAKIMAEMASRQSGTSAAISTPYISTGTTSTSSHAETRLIIREEFDALSEHLLLAIGERSTNTNWPGKPQARILSADEKAQMNATVETTISDYSARGTASQSEMAALEIMIAKLPPRERIKAMGQLNKVINSGQLNTRF